MEKITEFTRQIEQIGRLQGKNNKLNFIIDSLSKELARFINKPPQQIRSEFENNINQRYFGHD